MNERQEIDTRHACSVNAASEVLTNLRVSKARMELSDFGDRWESDRNRLRCSFYAVLDGALSIVSNDGVETHTLCKHQFAFVFGDQYLVSNTVRDAYEPCRGIRASFELSMGAMTIGKNLMPPLLVSRRDDFGISQQIQLLECEMSKPVHCGRAVVTSMITTLLLSTLSDAVEQGDQSAMLLQVAGDEHLGPAIALMHESPGDAWSLERLANESGLSRTRFSERFQSTIGRSAFAYLRELRLSKASILLTTTSMTVCEIATEVGYSSESAFSSAFQEHFNETPGRYRHSYWVTGSSAAG